MTFEEYKNKILLKFAKGYRKYNRDIKTTEAIDKHILAADEAIDKHGKCWDLNRQALSIVKTNSDEKEMIYCTHCFKIVASYSSLRESDAIKDRIYA